MTTKSTSGWDLLDASHEALRAAVAGVPAGDWARPTPCEQWNLAQVLRHATGDQIGYAAFLTGEPGPDENPFAPSDTAPGDPAAHLEEALERSARAWAGVDRAAAEVPVPIPPNKLSPEMGVAACALDAAVHAWDIAVAVGRPSPLSPELAARLLPAARHLAEPLRGFAFAAPLEPQEGDDDAAVLLRYLGRDPRWTA